MNKSAVFSMVFALTAAAQAPVDLSGIWERYNAASSPGKQPVDSMKLKIDQQGATIDVVLRVVQRGTVEQSNIRYIAGQETRGEMHGAPMTCRAEWDGAALVVHSTAKVVSKELNLTDRYTLSADGNRLTMHERHKFDTEPEGEETQVFDRRPVSTWEPDKPPAPAEEVYKNIQIMNGVPAPRLRTVMLNLTTWLGVECAYCHLMGQFDKDDKPAKQTARAMFTMVRAINQDNFPSTNAVTCWTCHRGAVKPQSLPAQ
jgi:hypothetical protein